MGRLLSSSSTQMGISFEDYSPCTQSTISDMLNVDLRPIDSFVGQWWVLHTRSRAEKTIATDLRRNHVQHYLPLVRCKRVYGVRIREVSIPLFPGYVFLCGDDSDRIAALKTNRVANILEVPDQDRFRTDLIQVQQVVESDEPVDLCPRLVEGARCRVLRGSLAGIEGQVLKRKGPWRVYVSVQFLGQSVELEIDPTMLEVLD